MLDLDGGVERFQAPAGDAYRGMVDHFSTAVRGGSPLRRPPPASVAVLEVMDRLHDSAIVAEPPP
ncbi:MAG: hypothetical protein ACR2G7_13800 [Acidimicrobiales bacterium]